MTAAENTSHYWSGKVDYLEREARNQQLGEAAELFVINFERARRCALEKRRLLIELSRFPQPKAHRQALTSGLSKMVQIGLLRQKLPSTECTPVLCDAQRVSVLEG